MDPRAELMAKGVQQAVDLAFVEPQQPAVLGEMLCSAFETIIAGPPVHTAFGDVEADADWWADCATPIELEIYAKKALQKMERTTFAPKAKKRLLTMLWASLTENERRDFIRAVTGR